MSENMTRDLLYRETDSGGIAAVPTPLRFYSELGFNLQKPRDGDVGYDLVTPYEVRLEPGRIAKIETGLFLSIPDNMAGLLWEKSSVAGGNPEKGLNGKIAIRGGLIDPSYRGEVIVALHNLGDKVQIFKAGQKICQLILIPYFAVDTMPVNSVEELGNTKRGAGGFGSTGQVIASEDNNEEETHG